MGVIMIADSHHWWKYHEIHQHSSFAKLSKLFSSHSTGHLFYRIKNVDFIDNRPLGIIQLSDS